MKSIVFVDLELNQNKKIADIAALRDTEAYYHGKEMHIFLKFIKENYFICGHNIIVHDAKYFKSQLLQEKYVFIDTLCISPLIYPKKIHHNLLKDDKVIIDELNNPLNDCKKTRDLFNCELDAFERLPKLLKSIFGTLLFEQDKFIGFFEYVKWNKSWNLKKDISVYFKNDICTNCDLDSLIFAYPVELAYALALISTGEKNEVVSPWVQVNFPKIDKVFKALRGVACKQGCKYCNSKFNIHNRLEEIFGYKNFRTYNGEKLQENAVQAAVNGKSLLAVFPTGGGKSLTFQLPALIAGETSKGLTVVISPLQSLMKDQVDGLEKVNITSAVTINGMLNPIERQNAIERVFSGDVSILYISPELLRSKTIEKMLLSRNIIRFVIDEAHCFSSWGQDFRVDYLYIADFIKHLQELKSLDYNIPISCFTATAKQKVITDICDYFKEKLDISLEIFATAAERKNLHYKVELKETEDEKYKSLREIIQDRNCPTIVYVSTTKKTHKIAEKLNQDGISALAFNGKMDKNDKVENQEAFINNEIQVMVATSAFGMGVNKSDVKLVVHYEISDSLENYVQESGRAGRNENIQAECIVFFNEDDLDKHFLLLKQTKLSIANIRQIWKAIKTMSSKNNSFTCSALELARCAGWDEDIVNIETSVRTAIAALEQAGYISRGLNSPRIFATSIHVKNLIDARKIIEKSGLFSETETTDAIRILSHLISGKNTFLLKEAEAESRVDYIADILGINKIYVIALIDKMRQCKILADSNDMTAYIKTNEKHKIITDFEEFIALERFILKKIDENTHFIDLKEVNDSAIKENVNKPTIKSIKTILFYWTISNYIEKTLKTSENSYEIKIKSSKEELSKRMEKRIDIASFILEYLFNKANTEDSDFVSFSMVELLEGYNNRLDLFSNTEKCVYEEIQESLLYLSKIGVITIEGGFLVLYNAMHIKRLILDNKIQYKNEDYKILKEHYELKTEQIHIVGKYANMLVKDYNQALEFVHDYFHLQYDGFIKKYFEGDKKGEIKRTITPAKYNKVFGELSDIQKKIIDDDCSQYIAVFAGPGSGKTKVLVHKLASLLLLEDIKSEQLLMLTFSRAAANEFKTRLIKLIGSAANYVDIKTFHSYCFDLLGKLGNAEEFDNVVESATILINSGEAEPSKITKVVLVIDEAQDMDEKDYNLIQALIDKNPEMKVIAVGDDDQCVYEFRDANPEYMQKLICHKENGKQYELLDNYRSVKKIIDLSNAFVKNIEKRMKTNPINFVRKESGNTEIVVHKSEYMENAIVEHIVSQNYKNKTIAVLTQTNEEALRVLSLLNKNNIQASLVQSNTSFNLYNLVEIKYFIKKCGESPIISEETWHNAQNELYFRYSKSTDINLVKRIIGKYAELYPNKYITDFIEFVKESKIEDFSEYEKSPVIVSTIHKSKGHEFDIVYLLLSNLSLNDDKKKRQIYVGLTRAKTELYIHCNKNIFSYMKNFTNISYNNIIYKEPEELILQLTHSNIHLGMFKSKSKKAEILSVCSGDELVYINDYLSLKSGKISKLFKFSNAFSCFFESLVNKGYSIKALRIKHIVLWIDKAELDFGNEYAIILPEIIMKKN